MSSAAEQAALRAQLEAALALAALVTERANAGSYTTVRAYEADVNEARQAIADALPEVSAVWGSVGWELVQLLQRLGAQLLDLRALVSDVDATVTETVTRPTSLIELAVLWHRDHTRWEELSELNPSLRHLGEVPAGTEVVRRVQ